MSELGSRRRPHWPRLYVIVDAVVTANAGWRPPDLARACVEGGARLVQLRAPDTAADTVLRWSEEIASVCVSAGAEFILNDRSDLALLSNANGVHLGQEDLPAPVVRRLLGAQAVIGLSTHNLGQVQSALRQPVSYLAVGPIFDTRTKDTGYVSVGLDGVRRTVAAASGLPVVAIGGITLATAPTVIAAGAASVAVVSDLLANGAPDQRVRQYLAMLEGS
ncbi:uncharacterized protein METZ01_LOCUS129135 [marine metagenome]|uniref:thiamine phosphate synthase n=1 Tax=marine metagenome TaxID=408172 RepID=A0A381YIB1_9ZZZZ